MTAMVAVIRRLPGGTFGKVPKTVIMPAVPLESTVKNYASYFCTWPKHHARFLTYGSYHMSRFALKGTDVGATHIEEPFKRAKATQANEDDRQEEMHLYGPSAGTRTTTDADASLSRSGGCGARVAVGQGKASAEAHASTPAPGIASSSPKVLGWGGVLKRFQKGQKLTMITAYDYPSARFAHNAGTELVLVGDSVGNCRLGLPDTIGVTMDDMLRATSSVRRGLDAPPPPWSVACEPPKPILIGDMPFGSYLVEHDALKNAASFRKAGADMVKLEGGRQVAALVQSLTRAGIAVMAHIGLEPQHAFLQGGLRLQGTTADAALKIIGDAKELAAAGAVSVVVECVPAEVGYLIQAAVPTVPVIGIGAGSHMGGQVLVCDDLLGVHGKPPSFAKRYADMANITMEAYSSFVSEVRDGSFPAPSQTRCMKVQELLELTGRLSEVDVQVDHDIFAQSPSTESPMGPSPTESEHAPFTMPNAKMIHSHMRKYRQSSELRPRDACRFVSSAAPTASASKNAKPSSSIQILRTRDSVNTWRKSVGRVALVPTMGNLHEGHLALVDAAHQHAEHVIVSIFVNPSQFAAHEDFGQYPRTFDRDVELLRERGVSALFCPEASELYPSGSPGDTMVVPQFVQGKSEAACRPHFFAGVATVCLKLFNICRPDVVVFGQKDAMQCVVIERMLKDLMLDTSVSLVVMPTSREADGLARSSRNSYLTPDMRRRAPAIYKALTSAVTKPGASPDSVRSEVRAALEIQGFEVQYVSVADSRVMQEADDSAPLADSIISIACLVRDGDRECRLIDCIVV